VGTRLPIDAASCPIRTASSRLCRYWNLLQMTWHLS